MHSASDGWRFQLLGILCLVVALGAVGCGGDGNSEPADVRSVIVTPDEAATLTSEDGVLTLDFPAGAVDQEVTISARPLGADEYPERPEGALLWGPGWELLPNGQRFSAPVTATVGLVSEDLPEPDSDGWSVVPGLLLFSSSDEGEILHDATVRFEDEFRTVTLTAPVRHFSKLITGSGGDVWGDGKAFRVVKLSDHTDPQPVGSSWDVDLMVEFMGSRGPAVFVSDEPSLLEDNAVQGDPPSGEVAAEPTGEPTGLPGSMGPTSAAHYRYTCVRPGLGLIEGTLTVQIPNPDDPNQPRTDKIEVACLVRCAEATPNTGSIEGRVFRGLPGGEASGAGLQGIVVQVHRDGCEGDDCGCGPQIERSTDEDGLYRFPTCGLGTYQISLDSIPDGMIVTTGNATQNIEVRAGQTATADPIGLVDGANAEWTFFHDRDGDRQLDDGEPGVPRARARVYIDADGDAVFDDGTYEGEADDNGVVSLRIPPGTYQQALEIDGAQGGPDNPVLAYRNRGLILIDVLPGGYHEEVPVAEGVTVTIELFDDANADGQLDPEEPFIPDVDVEITAATEPDQTIIGTTGADGPLTTNDLYPGDTTISLPSEDIAGLIITSGSVSNGDNDIHTFFDTFIEIPLGPGENVGVSIGLAWADGDPDGDGIPTDDEQRLGTDPSRADSDEDPDGDRMTTYFEFMNGYDPNDSDEDDNGVNDGEDDPDEDSVPNWAEAELGTDRSDNDTDGDGVYDDREDSDEDGLANWVELGTPGLDWRNPDSDRDGTPDDEEDSDGDGIPNDVEVLWGMDPGRQDSDEDPDQDSLTTYWEYINGYDATHADTDDDGVDDAFEDPDGDNVTNWDEQELGTNPNSADTDGNGVSDDLEDSDGDGIPDVVEVNTQDLDWTSADSDGDGTTDGDEDSDGDGLLNAWELRYGLSFLLADTDGNGTPDPAEDGDGDGLDNNAELWSGTNPTDPDTDDGGVVDGYEVVRGTDPLDPSDDNPCTATDSGDDAAPPNLDRIDLFRDAWGPTFEVHTNAFDTAAFTVALGAEGQAGQSEAGGALETMGAFYFFILYFMQGDADASIEAYRWNGAAWSYDASLLAFIAAWRLAGQMFGFHFEADTTSQGGLLPIDWVRVLAGHAGMFTDSLPDEGQLQVLESCPPSFAF